jgi:hypothetical protein
MAELKLDVRENVIEWQIKELAATLAVHSGHPEKHLIETFKEGLASGRLPTEIWSVKWGDGTRSRHEVIPCNVCFGWWKTDGPFPVSWGNFDPLPGNDCIKAHGVKKGPSDRRILDVRKELIAAGLLKEIP